MVTYLSTFCNPFFAEGAGFFAVDKLNDCRSVSRKRAAEIALAKIRRLQTSGFSLSLNDKKIVLFG
jgi:hypothetical protein